MIPGYGYFSNPALFPEDGNGSQLGTSKIMYAVGIEGEEFMAYFKHKEDAEYFASQQFFYPYKGWRTAEVIEVELSNFQVVKKK